MNNTPPANYSNASAPRADRRVMLDDGMEQISTKQRQILEHRVEYLTEVLHGLKEETDLRNVRGAIERALKDMP